MDQRSHVFIQTVFKKCYILGGSGEGRDFKFNKSLFDPSHRGRGWLNSVNMVCRVYSGGRKLIDLAGRHIGPIQCSIVVAFATELFVFAL